MTDTGIPTTPPAPAAKGDIVGWLRRREGWAVVGMPGKLAGEIADYIVSLQALLPTPIGYTCQGSVDECNAILEAEGMQFVDLRLANTDDIAQVGPVIPVYVARLPKVVSPAPPPSAQVNPATAYDMWGPIEFISEYDDYVMLRRERATRPFIITAKEWAKLPKDKDAGERFVCTGFGVLEGGERWHT